jgi:hypothetical protein
MRTMPLLVPMVLASVGACAQVPQVDRIDVVEYGLYTANTDSRRAEPNTATGTVSMISNIQHAVTTLTVPAQQGVRFGYRFVVAGAPAGAAVPLHMVTVFPPPGLTNPATQQLKARSEYDVTVPIGTTEFRGYNLTNDWEVVPGIWKIQVWYQGQMLAQQEFTVVSQ